MNAIDTDRACDAVWESLAATPARRALLGRRMADSIVRAALEEMPPVASGNAAAGCDRVERRVRRRMSDRHGVAFTTILLSWAISAIVQALVAYWWRQQREGQS